MSLFIPTGDEQHPYGIPMPRVPMSLRQRLREQHNHYDPQTTLAEAHLRARWHDVAPPIAATCTAISVIITTRNHAATLAGVLDAIGGQDSRGRIEVIVVDDASTDGSAAIAAAHPITTIVHELPEPAGRAAAINTAVLAARTPTIVLLGAQVLLPRHILTGFAARARDTLTQLGFLHPAPPGQPPQNPDLAADPRVRCRIPAGTTLPGGHHTDTEQTVRLLDHSRDLRDLGHGNPCWGIDLPSMVDLRLCAIPRRRLIACGGVPTGLPWPVAARLLAARLIAGGCLIAPVRSTVAQLVVEPGAGPHPGIVPDPAHDDTYQEILGQPYRPQPLTPHGLGHPGQGPDPASTGRTP